MGTGHGNRQCADIGGVFILCIVNAMIKWLSTTSPQIVILPA